VITCISNESLTEISALEILSNGIDGFILSVSEEAQITRLLTFSCNNDGTPSNV
jgi:hypothetical protein